MVVVVVLEEKIGLFLSILDSLSFGLGLGKGLLRNEGSFGFLQLQPMSTTTGWRLTTNFFLFDAMSNLVLNGEEKCFQARVKLASPRNY
jgi:hypothetical protein